MNNSRSTQKKTPPKRSFLSNQVNPISIQRRSQTDKPFAQRVFFRKLVFLFQFREILNCSNHLACVAVLVVVPRNNFYLICVVVNL